MFYFRKCDDKEKVHFEGLYSSVYERFSCASRLETNQGWDETLDAISDGEKEK